MVLNFKVDDLNGMKRAELQKLCKSVGIKANMKNARLVEALREYATQFSEKTEASFAEDQRAQDTSSVVANEGVSTETRSDQQDTEDSYKKQLMDQLEKKVEEKMPVECKIPRFVQFANKNKPAQETNKTPAAKWNKIHNAQFEKMDSIDVYLAKKRKRMEGFNQSAKRAKSIGVNRKSVGKPVEVPAFKPTVTNLNKSATFVFGSPVAKPFFQPATKQAKVSTATSNTASSKKLKLKSPKVFKPVLSGGEKMKTPDARRITITVATAGENKPKTPAANPARKSTAVTPFRFLPANVPAPAATPTPRKKFDLKASLSKPLPYKPHTGKLKPLSSYKEEVKPTVSAAKLKSRKVDVKSAKVTSREERRMKENKSRVDKRANALSRRRGIAC